MPKAPQQLWLVKILAKFAKVKVRQVTWQIPLASKKHGHLLQGMLFFTHHVTHLSQTLGEIATPGQDTKWHFHKWRGQNFFML